MRTLDVGRIVKTTREHESLPAGAIGRVLDATGNEILIQVAPNTRTAFGGVFVGHDGEGRVRSRGWYVPRTYLQSTREKVANAREFERRFGR